MYPSSLVPSDLCDILYFLSKFGMLKKYYIMFLRGTTSIPKDKVYILVENQSIQSLGEDIHTNINI
jgi:hypothetical protein